MKLRPLVLISAFCFPNFCFLFGSFQNFSFCFAIRPRTGNTGVANIKNRPIFDPFFVVKNQMREFNRNCQRVGLTPFRSLEP